MDQSPDTLPRLAKRSDSAYLDFVEGLRSFVLKDPSYPHTVEQALGSGGGALSIGEIKSRIDHLPAVRMHNRMMRSQQEMKWRKITASFDARRETLLAELDSFMARGPGRLELDPDFKTPSYANVNFHLQPGGYYRDPLGGVKYHYGTKVFFTGDNDQDELHAKLVAATPEPDGGVAQVLDLACSIGQSTTALKARFPSADVIGVDHSAAMLKAAHRRAALLGSEVTFSQRLAERTGFADDSFDLAFAFILFHELPIRVIQEVVQETARVLRPGGLFAVYDFFDSPSMSPVELYHRDFDARYNGEPYSQDFCDCDFGKLLHAAGFGSVATGEGGGYVKRWFATLNGEQ